MHVRGGRATVPSFPEGWTVLQVFVRGTNARGQIVVTFDYRSAARINDRLDCLPQ